MGAAWIPRDVGATRLAPAGPGSAQSQGASPLGSRDFAARPAQATIVRVKTTIVAALLALALAGAAYAFRHPLMEAAGLRNSLGQNSGRILRTEVPCPVQTPRTFFAVVLGQSNAGSSAQGRSDASPRVLNYFEGRCFEAKDPLLGTDGLGGSPWIEVGNGISERHDYIILAAHTVGGASIRRWDADIGVHLRHTLDGVKQNYQVTHFLWQQGESDADMSEAEYAVHLRKVIGLAREAFPKSLFYVSLTSRCGNTPRENGARAAQRAAIDPKSGILRGPDTDAIDERYDGCHFSDEGRLEAARLWAAALSERPSRP